MRRALPALLIGSALAWLALLVAAPFALHRHNPLAVVTAASTYRVAARVCHQRPERSFHLAGTQLPVCARCFGLYASGAVAAVAALGAGTRRRTPDVPRARLAFAIAAVPTVATVALEWAGLWYPGNVVRAMAALPLGATAGWVFVRMLREEALEPGVSYHA